MSVKTENFVNCYDLFELYFSDFLYNGYVERYEKAKGRYDELSAECEAKKAKGRAIERFLTDFAERDEPITEFDDCLWLTAIDRVTVRNDGVLVFRFNYGGEIEV